MKRVIMAVAAATLALGALGSAMADPDDAPGKSQFGRCQAIIHGNGQNKYDHGKAFRIYDDLDGDGELDDDGDDATNDFQEAFNYCLEYVAANHPGNPGGSGGGGSEPRPTGGSGKGKKG